MSKTSGSEGAELTLTYPANPSTTDSREIKVTFTTTDTEAASGEVVFTLTQAPYEALTRTAVVPYLELPKVSEADSLLYISHETTYNGTTLHSWSALYDLRYRVSPWVAYRLDKTLGLSNAERSQNFYYDPAVPKRDQADLTSGSYKGDGIRGHQLPSADRLLSREANDQTFYATNIAPQSSSFNEGIWVNLENSVRRWADKCDTLYVVTGCCVTTSANPDVKWSNDRNGKLVAYPQKYYKVVLSYSKSRTENGGYSAIGFILDNDSYADNTLYLSGDKSYAKPVSEIETLTGFDFFCNLPDDIEKKVEESVTLSDWQ
ncbi:MAG: DNA/RNA non-specific endonuclease [Bacteroidales bacterium]|nr:DNA/RNA non-specific endonuclease [Bacteroidales bacterium]